MKKIVILITIIIVAVIIAVSLRIWIIDIYSDRQYMVATLQNVALYTDWKCGLRCGEKNKAGEIPSGTRLKVLRIRYGKDYMAIRVEYNRNIGWLIYSSRDVELELKNGSDKQSPIQRDTPKPRGL
jgi:hypothetical protein